MVTACPIEWEPVDSPAVPSWFVLPVVPVAPIDGAGSARQFMENATNDITDEVLMGGIARGDTGSFAAFYDRYSGLLFSVAVHVLRDDREAEDVLQEAMVSLWERAALYDSSLGKPLSWAVTLTRNRAIDRLRGLKRRPQATAVDLEEADVASDESATATSHVMMQESTHSLRQALRGLPDDQRRAIELAFFQGLTHVEIAEAIHVPLGTVKARIRRGMLELRDALEGLL
jgi:RNA polymerase sigma-70 factor, ECF subfamily